MITMTCDRCGLKMEESSIPECPKIRIVIPCGEGGRNLQCVDLCPECEEKVFTYIFGKEDFDDQ